MRYKRYEQYKDSGIEWVGEIPEHWEVIKYKKIVKIVSGNGFPQDYQGNKQGDLPFYKVSDINFLGKYVSEANNYVNYDEVYLNKWNLISENSIITAKIGEALRKNHRKINQSDCLIDNNMMAILLKNSICKTNYFYYFLTCVNMEWYSNAGAVPSVNINYFKNDLLIIPNKNEQQIIADFLDKKTSEIDTLIEEKEKLRTLLEEKRQAIITEAVTKGLNPNVKMKDSGIEWVGEIPEHWETLRLKDICIVNPKKSELKNNNDIEVTFLPMENIISTGLIDTSIIRTLSEVYDGYTYIKEGDIILAKVTPCFENGNIAVANGLYNGIAFGTTELHVLRVNSNINNRFIFYLLQTKRFKDEGISSMYGVAGLKRVPTEFVKNYKFALPSKKEQDEIVDFLDNKVKDIEITISTIKQQIQKLKEYRQSIIFEAVTGKIDLRDINLQ